MLVLSRHRDESIMIGDQIELTVVDIRGDKVRLGIDAPAHIAVHRKEIHEAIMRENMQAARIRQRIFGPVEDQVARPDRRPTRIPAAGRVELTDRTSGGEESTPRRHPAAPNG